ncbi:MAG: DUF2905 domain-containing protein [Saprospiraceae bacterium]|jgi:hypothetical protein|nr:DUF2905 domain-containing protein [Saprospiraceae bacterium]
MNPQIAKSLVIAGVMLIALGVLFLYFQDKLQWIGRLPGDFKYKSGNFTFFAPITSMLILSVLISILLNLIKKFS